jgi:hypothetical protein
MEQIQTQKKFAGKAFVGGMVLVGGLWIATFFVNSGYRSINNSSMDYSGGTDYQMADTVSSVSPFLSTTKPSPVIGNSQERTITNNSLSLHVKNVSTFHSDIVAYVRTINGKVMSENITLGADDRSESGTLSVLVPNKSSDDFFKLVDGKVIKVVDRQITSYQITQEYTDIEKQLARYEETYIKIQKYYEKAGTVSELLNLQSQLDQVQMQIDSLKGRKASLEELSSNSQYTLYSSTNEYNLPYVPQGTFEIAKTFKLAVRSLVAFTDKTMQLAIYVLVYSPIMLAVGGAYLVWKKYSEKKTNK